MKNILKRKKATKNGEWIDVINNIGEYRTKKEIDDLVKATVKDIKAKIKGKKVAYSWSGGKDSIALQYVCEKAGIKDCLIGISSPIEYPSFLKWVGDNKPEGLTIIDREIGIEYLEKHPEMVFPNDSKTLGNWYKIIQHKAQDMYYKDRELDLLVLGRRKQDGNYVGKGDNIYTNAQGVTRFSPLAEWKHEDILALIHYYELPVPPIYDWDRGYVVGTHVWPSRDGDNIDDLINEINAIDDSILKVERVAALLEKVREIKRG